MADQNRAQRPDPTNDPEHVRQGAADRAHGTHGKGDSRESLETPATAAPDGSHDSSIGTGKVKGGTDGWGDAASGGSTVERRSEPRGKDKKKKK